MPALAPFTPANTVAITVTASSAVTALPVATATGLPTTAAHGDQVRISSLSGNAICYIAFGISTTTVVIPTGTAANGVPILPGTVETFTIPPGITSIAVIGTLNNTLYVTCGDGQ